MINNVKGITAELAHFIVNAGSFDSPSDIVCYAVLDCYGVILAGANSDVTQRVTTGLSINAQGNTPIYGTDRASSPANTALVNAVSGHAFDLDDWEAPANTHPSVVLLPACLAIAHRKRISGEDLLAAYAIGFEVIVRLGEALTLDHYNRGFHSTATIGSIGAAAAVARLLRLDVQATTHALSIATTQASGYTLQFGTHTKPLQAGFAARIGVESGLLAEAGITATHNVIESTRGFAGLMGVAERALNPLGNPWALNEFGILFKLWPSCGYTHRLMTAALALREQVIDRLDRISAIDAILPDFHRQILPFDCPQNHAEALFSIPACIAQILVDGDLTLRDLEQRFWENQTVAELIRRVNIATQHAINPAMNIDPEQPDCLRIQIDDEVLEHYCAFPIGAPQNPATEDQLAAKFIANSKLTLDDFHNLSDWPNSKDIGKFFPR